MYDPLHAGEAALVQRLRALHPSLIDLTTGRAICEPDRTRVRTYEVTVEPAEAAPTEPLAAETYPVTVEQDRIVLHL